MREPSGAPASGVCCSRSCSRPRSPRRRRRPRGARLLKGWPGSCCGRSSRSARSGAAAGHRAGPAQTGRRAIGGSPCVGVVGRSSRTHHQAEAVAAAFLREYLTVGEDRAARAQRLGQFTARGVDLRRSVAVPAGVAQYADLVVPAGSRSVVGGVEVTVVAHVLQVRSGGYRDGGTLAFVVPLAVRQEGIGVTGRAAPHLPAVRFRVVAPPPSGGAGVPVAVSWPTGPTGRGRRRQRRPRDPCPPRRRPGAIDPPPSHRMAHAEHWRCRGAGPCRGACGHRGGRFTRRGHGGGPGPCPTADGPGQLPRAGPRPARHRPWRAHRPPGRCRRVALSRGPEPNRHPAAAPGAAGPGPGRPGDPAAPGVAWPGAGATPGLRPGWYAYQVVGPATVPSWATEIALTIERPADLDRGGGADRTDAAARPGLTEPRGLEAGARPARPGPPELGGPAPMLEQAEAPAVEWAGGPVQAIVLLRAAGRANWLAGIAEAAMEVETAAGIRPVARVDAVAEVRAGSGRACCRDRRCLDCCRSARRRAGRPGSCREARASRSDAALATGGRRRAAVVAAGAGSVLTCDGPCGVSAQAVVALRGAGRLSALAPPPGRCPGAPRLANEEHLGRGVWAGPRRRRDARPGTRSQTRRRRARAEGWDAVVLHGLAALDLARAGGPGQGRRRQTPRRLLARRWRRCSRPASPPEAWAWAAWPQWSLAVTP